MKKKAINITLVKSFRIRKKYIIGILLALLIESGISLGLPGILSKIIDGLGNESVKWLISFVFVFLGLVIIKGLATIINSLLSEAFLKIYLIFYSLLLKMIFFWIIFKKNIFKYI